MDPSDITSRKPQADKGATANWCGRVAVRVNVLGSSEKSALWLLSPWTAQRRRFELSCQQIKAEQAKYKFNILTFVRGFVAAQALRNTNNAFPDSAQWAISRLHVPGGEHFARRIVSVGQY